jgi:hypothetical protein
MKYDKTHYILGLLVKKEELKLAPVTFQACTCINNAFIPLDNSLIMNMKKVRNILLRWVVSEFLAPRKVIWAMIDREYLTEVDA